MSESPYERAKILWVGTVTTAEDGYTPVIEGWGFDRYAGVPLIDHERNTICGWPIHELAAMAARDLSSDIDTLES